MSTRVQIGRTAVKRLPGFVTGLLVALPGLISSGWRQDASRRGLFVPVLFGCGAGLYFWQFVEPPAWTALAAPLLVSCWLVSRRFGPIALNPAFGVLAAISVGYAATVVRAQTLMAPVIQVDTRMLSISGRIADAEFSPRGRMRIWLDLYETDPALPGTPARIRLSTNRQSVELQPGDWITTRASLKPLPSPVAPGTFDFGRKLWFEGIGGMGFSLAPVEHIPPLRPVSGIERLDGSIQVIRHAISNRILAAMSPRIGPIAVAFLTGERGLISDEDNQDMRDSSLAHLLSISGLHMMLAGFGFFMALRILFSLYPPLILNHPVKKWAAAAALAVSFAYLLLSGASVPTQRAFVTVLVAFTAIIFDRSALNMRTVAVAALAVLVVAPESWLDPSFQMSFSAVVALVAAYEWWNARRVSIAQTRGPLRHLLNMLVATAATSLVAGIATAPFAAYHFNRFSDYGVAANVLVMPIVSFVIMPSGVLALLVMPFGIEWIPLSVMEWGLERMLQAAHWVASWPGATQAVGAFPIEALTAIIGGGLWIALWQSTWRWLGLFVIVIGLMLGQTGLRADIIISDDGSNVAVRDAKGILRFLSSRRGRFDAEMWLRADGDSRDVGAALKDANGAFNCDESGCIATVGSNPLNRLVISRTPEALAEDCKRATVLIDFVRGAHPPCQSPQLVVTPDLLLRAGAIAAHLEGSTVTWISVSRERGLRPWSRQPPDHGARLSTPHE